MRRPYTFPHSACVRGIVKSSSGDRQFHRTSAASPCDVFDWTSAPDASGYVETISGAASQLKGTVCVTGKLRNVVRRSPQWA